LIERLDILNWRRKYLVNIKVHHSEDRQVFYLDERWVDNNWIFKKWWQNEGVRGACTNGNAGKRLIMVHVGSAVGFLHVKVKLFLYRPR
jgi:hypothetical protein